MRIQAGTKFIFICLIMLLSLNGLAAVKQNTVEQYLQQAKLAGKKPNHLIEQSSPYLLQHAYNPVNWYAWGEAAFAAARKQHKPIFLSIGYSTCHWCHVMEHESFENKKIADYLNKHFIAIKVDREERPDIDAVYMDATQLISGSGGWPMTVFLDNQLRPFHAATYYPPFSTPQYLGLMEVLQKINQLWHDDPERITSIAKTVTERIRLMAKSGDTGGKISPAINELAMKTIQADFDQQWGGFGVAPKFPKPGVFAYLTRQAKQKNKFSRQAATMMTVTLDAMADGGFYDQLGGGFHRYSVDEQWQVPHFEKMLYSQALLPLAYLDFYPLQPRPRYKQVITQTLDFAAREMHSPQGGFYTALDADSARPGKPDELAEGAYYLWSEAELKNSLSKDEYAFIHDYYGIQQDGNIASDPRHEFGKTSIFYIAEDYRDKPLTDRQQALLQSAKKKLNAIRLLRPRPRLDDKIITAWNGMMISAYAKAASVFKDHKQVYQKQAISTANFILQHLYAHKTGKLFRAWRNGKASGAATLNDYAWLINGLLSLYDVSHDSRWLQQAVALEQTQDKLFLDTASGAYYEVAQVDNNVLFRSISLYDGALPAANAIVRENLLRLSKDVTDKKPAAHYRQQANGIMNHFATVINQNPVATAMALSTYSP